MNSIKQIRELNKRELENGVSPEASWHIDYRDTAYIFIGGLPLELSEGDIVAIFSQYGEPVFVNLVRDKETGKSRGFAFLKYEDQRSTDLAVDNLGGTTVLGRILRVDHTRYKRKAGEEESRIPLDGGNSASEKKNGTEKERPLIKEERELYRLMREHDKDDPMKEFLVQEKKDEVKLALERMKPGQGEKSGGKHRHRHHHRTIKREDEEALTEKRSRHRRRSYDERRRSRSSDYDRDSKNMVREGSGMSQRRRIKTEELDDPTDHKDRRRNNPERSDLDQHGRRRPRRHASP